MFLILVVCKFQLHNVKAGVLNLISCKGQIVLTKMRKDQMLRTDLPPPPPRE